MGVKKTNNGLYHIIQIMLLVGTLVVANVLFTMITKKHIWSRQDALNSQIASSIVDTVTKGKRGTIKRQKRTNLLTELTMKVSL